VSRIFLVKLAWCDLISLKIPASEKSATAIEARDDKLMLVRHADSTPDPKAVRHAVEED
jgi:hypothetical protein